MIPDSDIATIVTKRNAAASTKGFIEGQLDRLDRAGKSCPAKEIEADRLFNQIEDMNEAIFALPITSWRDVIEKILILQRWCELENDLREPIAAMLDQLRQRAKRELV